MFKVLCFYGVEEDVYNGDEEMFGMIYVMCVWIV